MTIILTNDDGHDGPGLAALAAAAGEFGEIVVVAPAVGMSGCGHQVTTTAAIRVERPRHGWYVVHGTPADCVRLALTELVPGAAWVLSGINPGGNLGADTYISGTVAAAREAALHGVPAVAVSHYRRRGMDINWDRAAQWTRGVLRELFRRRAAKSTYYNVNLPHLEGHEPEPSAVECFVDPNPLQVIYRSEGENYWYAGNYHERPRRPGSDVDVCFGGQIAVSLIDTATG